MIKINEILEFLKKRYPLDTACDFDNVGLLVGDKNTQIDKAIVALDCDINALQFAKLNGIGLIITHHPVIFDGIKSVTAGSIVYELVKSGISVISMHTNLDIAEDGVTAQLCRALGFKNIQSFVAEDGFTLKSAECDFTDADTCACYIKKALGGAVRYVGGNTPIKRVLVCSGSGGGFLGDAIGGGFDALITADVKHNVFIDAQNSGIALFDAGHYHSENIIVKPLAELLKNNFSDVGFIPYSPDTIKSI